MKLKVIARKLPGHFTSSVARVKIQGMIKNKEWVNRGGGGLKIQYE